MAQAGTSTQVDPKRRFKKLERYFNEKELACLVPMDTGAENTLKKILEYPEHEKIKVKFHHLARKYENVLKMAVFRMLSNDVEFMEKGLKKKEQLLLGRQSLTHSEQLVLPMIDELVTQFFWGAYLMDPKIALSYHAMLTSMICGEVVKESTPTPTLKIEESSSDSSEVETTGGEKPKWSLKNLHLSLKKKEVVEKQATKKEVVEKQATKKEKTSKKKFGFLTFKSEGKRQEKNKKDNLEVKQNQEPEKEEIEENHKQNVKFTTNDDFQVIKTPPLVDSNELSPEPSDEVVGGSEAK